MKHTKLYNLVFRTVWILTIGVYLLFAQNLHAATETQDATTCVSSSAYCGGSCKASWNTPGNATTDDTNNATASNKFKSDASNPMERLVCDDYGFTNVSGTIDGITVTVIGYDSQSGGCEDYTVRLIDETSTATGDDKERGATRWATSETTWSYGGATDDWSSGLTAADIRNANFGVYIDVISPANTQCQPYVDHMQIAVDYTNLAPIGSFNSAIQKTNGSGDVDISIEVDDSESGDLRAQIAYEADDTCDSFSDVTLDEAAGTTADTGTPDVENDNTYQVGDVSPIPTTSGSNTVTFVWNSDLNQGSGNGTMCLQLTANDEAADQSTPDTQTLTIDNVNPATPGNLTDGGKDAGSITLNFGSDSSDTNWDRYRIFYKAGTSGVTETDSEHSDADLLAVDFNSTSSTTVGGLAADTDYVFNIWAYDDYCTTNIESCTQNKSSATEVTIKTDAGAATIDVSGTCDQANQTTDCTDTGTVRVAVNGTLQAQEQTTVGGTWTISGITSPTVNDVITVFIEGAADAREAVAVTVYDGGGDITGVTLFEEHLTLGSDDTPATITNTILSNYDNSIANGDGLAEDVFFEVDGSLDLTVDTTGNLTQEKLYIPSGWTYRPDSGSSGNVTTHDIENNGTITADGNTFTLNGSWDNNSVFTANTSTVTLTATSGTETIDSTGATTATFNNLTLNGSGGTFQLESALDVDGALTITAGTLDTKSGSNYAITVSGNLDNNGTFTARTGTVTLDGTTAQTVSMNSGTFYDLVVSNTHASGVTFNEAFTTTDFTNITASSKMVFLQGGTFTINGTLNFNGQATGTRIVLTSTTTTRFTFSVASQQTASYVDVSYSNASGADIIASSSNDNTDNDSGEGGDEWIFLTPCTSTSTSFTDPTASTNRVAIVTTPANAYTENATDAIFADDLAQEDYHTFGFDLGTFNGTTILGVEITVNWAVNNATKTSHLDLQLRDADGNLFGDEKSTPVLDTTTDTTHTLGGATDLWGATLTEAIIESSNFGVSIQTNADGGSGTHQSNIDDVSIKIYHTTGDCFSVSGTCYENDQTTPCSDTGTIRIAVNSSLKTQTQTTVGENWSVIQMDQPPTDAIITTFIEGALETEEAVAITKYDGSGNITGMMLFEEHFSIGSDGFVTLSNSEMSIYDNSASGKEDIFFEIDANNDFSLITTGKTDAEIYIEANNTYRPDSLSSGHIDTHNLTIEGTLIADGNTITLGGTWENNGTFTANTSTVVFDGTAAAINGSTTFNNLTMEDGNNNNTDVTLTIDNTATLTITGTLTLDGIDDLDRINILSDDGVNRSDFSISGSQSASWLDVSDSEVSGTADITATNSLNTDNTDACDSSPQWLITPDTCTGADTHNAVFFGTGF